tara:strand:+ start:106 stop:393 length:288 start_codon:yes stop_codon:yes gene_type:complete
MDITPKVTKRETKYWTEDNSFFENLKENFKEMLGIESPSKTGYGTKDQNVIHPDPTKKTFMNLLKTEQAKERHIMDPRMRVPIKPPYRSNKGFKI